MRMEVVKVGVEIRSTARFRVGVHASSIVNASRLTQVRYPQSGVKVVATEESEGFLSTEPTPRRLEMG